MSRIKERIDVVLNNINISDFILYLGFDDIENYVEKYKENLSDIKKNWEMFPDLRLTQLLIHCGILPNKPGVWFYIEETDYLIENKIVKPEDILFWGTYGKDGKQPLKYITINNMTSEHIEACLKTQKNMNPFYRKIMTKVLRTRKLKTIKENEKSS